MEQYVILISNIYDMEKNYCLKPKVLKGKTKCVTIKQLKRKTYHTVI
jgi:hypothetical protein